MLIYIYVCNSQDARTTIIILNDIEAIKNYLRGGGFRFEVLTAVGIKITVFCDVTPCSSLERLQVSKRYLIFILGVTILLTGDTGVYRLHKILVFVIIRDKVVVILNFCICQETAIRRK